MSPPSDPRLPIVKPSPLQLRTLLPKRPRTRPSPTSKSCPTHHPSSNSSTRPMSQTHITFPTMHTPIHHVNIHSCRLRNILLNENSVRSLARGVPVQPMSYPPPRSGPTSPQAYYPSPVNMAFAAIPIAGPPPQMVQQQQQQQYQHLQQKRAPELEDDQGPKKKARATKAKGSEPSG